MAEISKQALKVANNTSFPNNNNGAITPAILRTFNVDMIDSLVDELGYNIDSASWNQQIDALEQYTASAGGTLTGSLLLTASAAGNVITFTKGNNTQFSITVATGSGGTTDLSQLNQATASLQAFTASANIKFANLESTTASLLVETQNLESFSASALVSISNLNASSASQQVSINSLNAATASYVTETESGSFLITASFDNGTRNLTFTKGNNTTFAVNIPDVSGSTGNFVTTSSFNAYTASTNQFTASTNTFTASVNTSITNLNTTTASLLVETANLETFSASALVSISNLNASSASQQVSINALNVFTASQSTASLVVSIDNLNATTASLLVETANLELFSASALISISNLNLSSASQQVSIDNLNARTGSYATTGSNSFNGNQIITGSVYISSSAAVDLRVEGQVYISSSATGATTAPRLTVSGSAGTSTINRNSISTRNLTNSAALNPSAIFNGLLATNDEIGFAVDPAAGGISGWTTGPTIYVNNTAGDTYPAVFGFQNKANYTDGRVTVLTPLIVTNGLQVTGSTAISGAIEIKGNVNQLTGSITAFGNVRTTNGTFTSSVNGGLEIDGIGYVGSGSAGAFFVGTTTQDLKIQNWYSSSVDGKNIVIENYSPTGSATPIFGKVALRARGVGGAVTVENSDQFRVEAPYSVFSGSVYIATGSLQNGITETVVTYNTTTGELRKATAAAILSASLDAGEFWSTTTQSGSAGVSGSVTFNNSGSVAGISVVNNSRVTLSQAGTYNIQFSAQIETSAGADTIHIWFKKNGNNIAASASKAVLPNNTAQIMTVNLFDEAVANDYYELGYQTLNGNATVLAEAASGNIPAIPSVILTIQQIR